MMFVAPLFTTMAPPCPPPLTLLVMKTFFEMSVVRVPSMASAPPSLPAVVLLEVKVQPVMLTLDPGPATLA